MDRLSCRVGLLENGQCVDRNGNGRIDTSSALGDVREWSNAGEIDTDGGVETAADECILNYVRVNSSGTRHVSVDRNNDAWVSGTGGQIFDLIDGKTGEVAVTVNPWLGTSRMRTLSVNVNLRTPPQGRPSLQICSQE